LTKCDALDGDTIELVKSELEATCGVTPFLISSVANQGLKPVLFQVYEHVKARREKEEAAREEEERKSAIAKGEIEETVGWQP